MKPEARVGLVVVVAVVLFAALVAFLGRGILRRPGYELLVVFPDAEGLSPGSPVHLAGVQIGTVEALRLTHDHRAEVRLRIRPEVRLPRGSVFRVATSTLLGNRFLAVTAGPGPDSLAPGEVVEGQPPYSVDVVFQRVDELASDLRHAVADVRRAVQAAQGLVENLDATVTAVREVVTDPRLVGALVRAARHVENAAAQVETTAAQAGRDVRETARGLRDLADHLREAAREVRRFVEDTSGKGELSGRIRRTAESVERLAGRLDDMARTLQEGLLREDQMREVRGLVQDARRAVRQAEEAAREVGTAARRVGDVAERAGAGLERLGGILRAPEGVPLLPNLQLTYELGYDTRTRFRHDLDLWVTPNEPRFYRLGLHDVGQANWVNLQVGFRLSDQLSWRVGIVQSQVGVGFDYRLGEQWRLSVELYNLNRLTLDVAARYGWMPHWAVGLHARDVLQSPSYGLGIQYRF